MKFKNMAAMLDENKLTVFYIFALNILLLIPASLSPIFKKVFTDSILTDGVMDWLAPLLILMTATALIAASVTWMQKSCLLKLSNKIEISGTGKYIWIMLCSPLNLFHRKDGYQLLSQADASKRVSKLLTRDLLGLLFSIVSVVFYMIMMMRLDLLMSAVVVALVVLNFLMSKIKDFLAGRLSREDKAAPDPHDLMLQEERINSAGLENIETFKSTASETLFFQKLIGSRISIINASRDKDFEEASGPFESLPEVIFLNILLLVSAFRIMDRNFSIGTYLAFQAYASMFFTPLSDVLHTHELFGKIENRLKKLYKGLDTGEKEIPLTALRDQLPVKSADKLDGYIEIKNVCFGYNGGPPVLQDINLSVSPGQRVAILGNSGAGKTTLLKLLQGLYEPDSGNIYIDGVNPARIDKRLFANSIGCANQEIAIFAASVRDNITMWDESISDADVYLAASDACIHNYIALQEGAYNYKLTEDGSNLSGGQRQRLEIARALLYKPSIVLLDEATSAIDPANRVSIEENLAKRGCACIVVTHVLSQIEDYDEIIIMDQGRIIQTGTHEELMRSSAFYASLFEEEKLAVSV